MILPMNNYHLHFCTVAFFMVVIDDACRLAVGLPIIGDSGLCHENTVCAEVAEIIMTSASISFSPGGNFMHIKDLGEYFKEYRLSHNQSQHEFAEALGISKQTLSTYEQGLAVPAMPVIMRFIEISDAPVEEFELIEEYINKIESPEERSAVIKAFGLTDDALLKFRSNENRDVFFGDLITKLRENIDDVF